MAPSSDASKLGEITLLLHKVGTGDAKAADQILPLVYEELRKLAAAKMARETPGQTLQPTALVHEVWLRLGADDQPSWQNRAHFFSAAAEAMRRILIENARRRKALRHGGGWANSCRIEPAPSWKTLPSTAPSSSDFFQITKERGPHIAWP
jgi:RNA polymerase sigma factor (TIGR02999 family)